MSWELVVIIALYISRRYYQSSDCCTLSAAYRAIYVVEWSQRACQQTIKRFGLLTSLRLRAALTRSPDAEGCCATSDWLPLA